MNEEVVTSKNQKDQERDTRNQGYSIGLYSGIIFVIPEESFLKARSVSHRF